jgi:hypothetical protein
MVINDFHFVGVAFAEFEANSPTSVHGHRPLMLAVALELVKPHALERTQVLQSCRDVQSQEQVYRRVEIQAFELVRTFPLPNPTSSRVAPRPDHGNIVLRRTDNYNVCRCNQRCFDRSAASRSMGLLVIDVYSCHMCDRSLNLHRNLNGVSGGCAAGLRGLGAFSGKVDTGFP